MNDVIYLYTDGQGSWRIHHLVGCYQIRPKISLVAKLIESNMTFNLVSIPTLLCNNTFFNDDKNTLPLADLRMYTYCVRYAE